MGRRMHNDTYEARVVNRRKIPWSAFVIWLTAVGISGWRGYLWGLKIAKENGFDSLNAEQFIERVIETARPFFEKHPHRLEGLRQQLANPVLRDQFVTMEFQFPLMVACFGGAQVLPVATVELFSVLRLLKLSQMLDRYLLECFSRLCAKEQERQEAPLLDNEHGARVAYGSLLEGENDLDARQAPLPLKRQSRCEWWTEFGRIILTRVAHSIGLPAWAALPALPYVVGLISPTSDKLNDIDFQFTLSEWLAVVAMLLQLQHTYDLFRGSQWTLSNSTIFIRRTELRGRAQIEEIPELSSLGQEHDFAPSDERQPGSNPEADHKGWCCGIQ